MTENNQNQDSKLTVYELAVLLDPKLSESKAADKIAALGDIVAQESGAVLSSGEMIMRNLAYEITVKNEGKRRDFNKAYFNWIKFEQDPSILPAIETKLKADKHLIRHLIIKTTREDYVTGLTDEYDPTEDSDLDDDSADSDSSEIAEATDPNDQDSVDEDSEDE